MAPPELAAAASSYGVLMGLSPILQIRRMLREKSSRDVSIGNVHQGTSVLASVTLLRAGSLSRECTDREQRR
jgi:hypothetical protein